MSVTDSPEAGRSKPNKTRNALRIAGGILLLFIAAVILLFRSPWLRNTIALAALSPSSYYKMTEAAGLASDTGTIADTAKKIASYINPGKGKGNAFRLSAHIRFSDGLLPFSLSFPDITADMTFSFSGGLGKTTADLQSGLLKLKALGFANPADGTAWLGFPDLTDSYLKYTSSPKTFSLPGGARITPDLRTVPAEEWKSLFQKLAKILSDSADSVVLTKKQTVECSGLSGVYTELQVLFEAEAQCRIIETLCTEPALNHASDSSGSFNRAEFLEQAEPLTMTVWVDSNGRVRGREFQSAGKPFPSLSWLLITDGDRYGFSFHSSDGSSSGGADGVFINGTAWSTETGLSGNISTAEGTTIRFTDLSWDDRKTEPFSGSFEVIKGPVQFTADLTLCGVPFEAFTLPDESAVKIYDFSNGISGFLKDIGLF